MSRSIDFSELEGKTLARIEGMEKGSDHVLFIAVDGSMYDMLHHQDCCECVDLEDVCGDPADLIGTPILKAEMSHFGDEPPDDKYPPHDDSFTWTFYTLRTNKGTVTLRWFGTSNGYYSEEVDFRYLGGQPRFMVGG